jgi:hypothetical protein
VTTAIFVVLSFLFTSFNTQAGEYLSEFRQDSLTPSHCKFFKIERFARAQEWFVYGIEGSTQRGFDYEVPINRNEANWLWKAFQDGSSPRNWPAEVTREVEMIKEHKDPMGFNFKAEGDVLELLAILDLEERYPESHYYHTGGVAYHEAGRGRIIGEIDLIVADRRTCDVVAVGESKLGMRSLSHARDQLRRFQSFLRAKIGYIALPQFALTFDL